MAVKLIIDSASDINQKEAEEMGIILVPMEIRFKDEEFLDGVTITPSQFYEKLTVSADLPKTSLVNQFRWEEEFEKATKNGDEVVVITISSKLSGTYQSAVAAAENFKGVYVVDSLNACLGERLLALHAMKLIAQGMSASAIADELNEKKSKIVVMAMVNTLKYLKKGGRISAAVEFAGELFNIKPVVALVEGEVKMIGKSIGTKKATVFLNNVVEKDGGIDFDMPFGVIWSGTDETIVQKYMKDSEHLWKDKTENVPCFAIGSTIGTHVGPGAFGISYFKK